MSHLIDSIHAQEILDSRGNPTVRATVLLKNGVRAQAAAPSGASRGVHEAVELRDGEKKRYGGLGVKKAVCHINVHLNKILSGLDVTEQRLLDRAMILLDGTEQKEHLGANAILAVSLACARAGAKVRRMPLYSYLRCAFGLTYAEYQMPLPTMNIINGGRHAPGGADFQEYMIVPRQKTFRERVRCGSEVFHALGRLLQKKGQRILVGDEGGYAPAVSDNEEPLQMMTQAIKAASYRLGQDVGLGMDLAASEFYQEKKGEYFLSLEKKHLKAKGVISYLENLLKKYQLLSIEDPLAQDDWVGWTALTKALGQKVAVVGDDLFVTKEERVRRGIETAAANAVLIKVNQIGTLSETIDTILLAQENGFKISVSHRSGETEDTFIADLAVAVHADFVKFGSLSRSERVAKYNRLMEIEEEIS